VTSEWSSTIPIFCSMKFPRCIPIIWAMKKYPYPISYSFDSHRLSQSAKN
jgi:hypothetical protein